MSGVLDTYTEIHDGPYLRRPAVVGGVSPSPPFPVDAVTFEANDDLLRNGALSGVSDGRKFLMSVWHRTATIPDDRRLFVIGTFGAVTIGLDFQSDAYFCQLRNSGGSNRVDARSVATGFDDGDWHQLVFTADIDAGQSSVQLMVDGSLSTNVLTFLQGQDINYSTSTGGTGIGRAVPVDSKSWVGDLAQFYVNLSENIDLSVQSNREKFIKNGKPVDFGSNGSLVTGSQPELFFDGDKDNFATNKGTAGAFSLTGALTDASTSPSD